MCRGQRLQGCPCPPRDTRCPRSFRSWRLPVLGCLLSPGGLRSQRKPLVRRRCRPPPPMRPSGPGRSHHLPPMRPSGPGQRHRHPPMELPGPGWNPFPAEGWTLPVMTRTVSRSREPSGSPTGMRILSGAARQKGSAASSVKFSCLFSIPSYFTLLSLLYSKPQFKDHGQDGDGGHGTYGSHYHADGADPALLLILAGSHCHH